MKTKLLLSILLTGILVSVISCKMESLSIEDKSVNQKIELVEFNKKVKKDGFYNFLPSNKNSRLEDGNFFSSYYGIEYKFSDIPSYEICCDVEGKRTTYINVRNHTFNAKQGLVFYIAIQKNMDLLSYSIPTGYFTRDYFNTDPYFNIYKWNISIGSRQNFTAVFNTQFTGSDVEGLMGVYIPSYQMTTFCDETQINLIHNADGNCIEDNRVWPGCM